MKEIGSEITWRSLSTNKVRTGYIVSINPNGTYQVKNAYGDTWTVSESDIVKE